MSWDLIVFAVDTPMISDNDGIASFADKWEAANIGMSPEVQQSISLVFPEVDWSDTSWGILNGNSYSLEFSLGSTEQINTFSIHARGEATQAVMQLVAATDWKILDAQTMKWLNQSVDPDEGRKLFQSYLDTVIEQYHKPEKRGFLRRIFGR